MFYIEWNVFLGCQRRSAARVIGGLLKTLHTNVTLLLRGKLDHQLENEVGSANVPLPSFGWLG